GFTVAKRILCRPEFAHATVMMLSSGDRQEDVARCRALGLSAYLTKPITQSNLLDAIVKALGISFGNESRQSPAAPPPKVTGRRILLAEDNPVNQLLMVRLLEKQGHSVTVVANGEEALTALEHDSFHLLIMDLQMPVMGGLEATAIIREQEKNTGKRLPI